MHKRGLLGLSCIMSWDFEVLDEERKGKRSKYIRVNVIGY